MPKSWIKSKPGNAWCTAWVEGVHQQRRVLRKQVSRGSGADRVTAGKLLHCFFYLFKTPYPHLGPPLKDIQISESSVELVIRRGRRDNERVRKICVPYASAFVENAGLPSGIGPCPQVGQVRARK